MKYALSGRIREIGPPAVLKTGIIFPFVAFLLTGSFLPLPWEQKFRHPKETIIITIRIFFIGVKLIY
jgi:hypothetical protein